MRTKICLSSEEVHRIADACKSEAQKRGRACTVAIVDEAGLLLYLERGDGQGPNSIDMSTGKARTAAVRERPTSALEERVRERPGFLTYPGAIAVRGGVPLFYEGVCVGGVGVSGVGNDDEPVAKAGAAALAGKGGAAG